MREMEKEMQIAQDQISARREEQERSTQTVRRLESSMIVSYYLCHRLAEVMFQPVFVCLLRAMHILPGI